MELLLLPELRGLRAYGLSRMPHAIATPGRVVSMACKLSLTPLTWRECM